MYIMRTFHYLCCWSYLSAERHEAKWNGTEEGLCPEIFMNVNYCTMCSLQQKKKKTVNAELSKR